MKYLLKQLFVQNRLFFLELVSHRELSFIDFYFSAVRMLLQNFISVTRQFQDRQRFKLPNKIFITKKPRGGRALKGCKQTF